MTRCVVLLGIHLVAIRLLESQAGRRGVDAHSLENKARGCWLETPNERSGHERRCFLAGCPWLVKLIRLSAILLSGSLPRQSFFHTALRSRLEVVGVALHFLDDVFGLHLALESAQGAFNGLTLLQSNFCQISLLNQT
jgi:hypothetical protein